MSARQLLAFVVGCGLPVAFGACDVFYVAGARVPLVAPLDANCLRASIGRGPQRWRRQSVGKDVEQGQIAPVVYSTPSMFHNMWESVAQSTPRDSSIHLGKVYRDSATSLTAAVVQVNRRFEPANAPLVSAELAALLLDVRDACGGRSPGDERLFSVDVNDTPYRAWVLRGTNGRVAMRVTVDGRRYWLMVPRNAGRQVLHVDTLAGQDARHPKWIEVDSLELPTLPKGATFAAECWRGDSTSSGDLVAVVRDADTRFLAEIIHAWGTDRRTLRIAPVSVEGIECLNDHYGSILPDGPRALRTVALTFRPASGMARIYVYLSSPDFPARQLMPNAAVDGQIIGRLQGGSFLMVEVEPGQHLVSSIMGLGDKSIRIDAAADSTYFVELRKSVRALKSRVSAAIADPARAQRFVRSAHMVPSSWPGTPRR